MTTAALETTETKAASPAAGDPALPQGVVHTRFGMVPATLDQQVRFKGGLPGFPGIDSFQLESVPQVDGDLMLLQSIDHVDVAFFVLPLASDQTAIKTSDIEATCQQLSIPADDLLMLTVVNLQRDGDSLEKYVNLRAPIFIDIQKQTGSQVVLNNANYPLRLKL